MSIIAIQEKINYIATELNEICDHECYTLYYNTLTNMINSQSINLTECDIVIDIIQTVIENNKYNSVYDMRKQLKEQHKRIISLEDTVNILKNENIQLKNENIQLKYDNIQLRTDIRILTNKISENEKNDKIVYVAQACSNMQKYIVRKVTGWNDREYSTFYEQQCCNNYSYFKDDYKEYLEEVYKLEQSLEINNLLDVIWEIKNDRNIISHPKKINIEKLNAICEELCGEFNGITKIGKNYSKIDINLLN
jgi:hypothetical protein